jgi:hypothetical protein
MSIKIVMSLMSHTMLQETAPQPMYWKRKRAETRMKRPRNVVDRTVRRFLIWKHHTVRPATFPSRFDPNDSNFRGFFLLCGPVQATKRVIGPLGGKEFPY